MFNFWHSETRMERSGKVAGRVWPDVGEERRTERGRGNFQREKMKQIIK